jgi:hypothetical protein
VNLSSGNGIGVVIHDVREATELEISSSALHCIHAYVKTASHAEAASLRHNAHLPTVFQTVSSLRNVDKEFMQSKDID